MHLFQRILGSIENHAIYTIDIGYRNRCKTSYRVSEIIIHQRASETAKESIVFGGIRVG